MATRSPTTDALQAALAAAHGRSEVLRVRTMAVLAQADVLLEQAREGILGAPRVERLLAEVTGLRRAMESRAVIEQAKGILIGATGCDADRAFELLVQQSQHENRKLREVAEALVAKKVRVSRPPSPR